MEIKLYITPKKLAYIMISAVEGNHMTRAWVSKLYVTGTSKKWDGKLWYGEPSFYEEDFSFSVVEYDEVTGEKKVRRITQKKMQKGVKLMAEKYAGHFADWFGDGGWDNITADTFLQCVALGEVVYG